MAIDIRALTPSDARAKRALRLEMLALHPEAFTSDAAEEAQRLLAWTEERITPSADKPHDLWLGAFDDGVLVGCVGLAGRYRAKERHNATLVGMMVHPRARGRGVGKQLLDAVLERARAIPSLTHIDLTVTQGNDSAQRLYEAAGFTVFGVHPDAIRVGDRHYAKVLMLLPLRTTVP
ncbi:GNAT family N-acetyltransferase [Curvibacter sp. APW13]|uniref:GNAT family N-acetyltransferase n=1 Tax=Curvibacter sp. APW13 TaxID=3077236 RepID=UPI0028DEE3D4|nr:GNAT family N-acetyltransferase [Curvibacter sp. APW13]MDT8989676.1 GNAT family N-acetyltransferase [Curvibacter sp. APW13]